MFYDYGIRDAQLLEHSPVAVLGIETAAGASMINAFTPSGLESAYLFAGEGFDVRRDVRGARWFYPYQGTTRHRSAAPGMNPEPTSE